MGSAGIVFDDFGATSGGLYEVGTDSNLYSINSGNGAATLIGATGLSLSGFRALSNNGSALYFSDGASLYTLNTATGAATLVGNMGGPGMGAMLFINGTLYGGADAPDIRVDTLDQATGIATSGPAVSGTTGQFYGLAPVPESATCACLALGGAMFAVVRHRGKSRATIG